MELYDSNWQIVNHFCIFIKLFTIKNEKMKSKKIVNQPVIAEIPDLHKELKVINSHEDISKVAHEIYFRRINNGIHGSAEQDWNNAIIEIKNQKISNIL